jgi:hypothetical protein
VVHDLVELEREQPVDLAMRAFSIASVSGAP